MKWFVVGMVAAAPMACAQVDIGFEAPDYALGGLEGQNGWYIPVDGSINFQVQAYGADPYGFVANPTGGEQFITGQWDGNNARAQLDHDFSGSSVWTISYDVNNIYDETDVAQNNIGSFSLQPSTTTQSYIGLNRFSPAAPTTWDADFIYYTSDNVQTTASPGAEWQGLEFNHWYRRSTTFDLESHQILEISITDLMGGGTTVFNPEDWYLNGGADSGLPDPSAFRFFASGNTANITAWDNLTVVPAPGAMALFGVGLLGAFRRRR